HPSHPDIYTLSLHDALPISTRQIISSSKFKLVFCLAETSTKTVLPPQSSGTRPRSASCFLGRSGNAPGLSTLLMATMRGTLAALDRKSTRLNSSHVSISYAV